MKKKIGGLFLGVVLFLAGCGFITDLSVQQETGLACKGINAIVQFLTPLKKEMKPSQIEIMEAAKKVHKPICTGSKPTESRLSQLEMLRKVLDGLEKVEREMTP